MKKIIAGILRRGFTSSKKVTLKDCVEYLYPLKYILEESDLGQFGMSVRCNQNPFWSKDNSQRIMELHNDIMGIHRAHITDTCYFRILNRFENGDGYGIIRQPVKRGGTI